MVRILLRPAEAWTSLRAANPSWTRSLFGYALPLSLAPAIAWPLGRGGPFAGAFLATIAFSLTTVVFLAAGLYALSRFFGVAPRWARSMAVAAHAATPVFLSGIFLVIPLLVIASVPAFLYSLSLCASGARILLGCREHDVAAFVAGACVLCGALSIGLGALCGAAGWI